MNYIYIFEGGSVASSSLAPYPADFDAIDNGILQVVRVPNHFIWDVSSTGADTELPTASIDFEQESPYHYFPF